MIKVASAFVVIILTFWVLSFEYNGKTIFNHFDKKTSTITRPIQNVLTSAIHQGYDVASGWFTLLFKNSVPQNKNSVKSKSLASPQENVSELDRAELDSLIRSHH